MFRLRSRSNTPTQPKIHFNPKAQRSKSEAIEQSNSEANLINYLRTMSDLKRTANEAPLKDVIDRWLKAYGMDGKMKELDIIAAWPEMMGTAVAHRTKEITIRNGTLYLKLDSSVMRNELLNGKQVIILRINEKAGYAMIRDIWFG